MTYLLILRGTVPSKKNNWKPRYGGGVRYAGPCLDGWVLDIMRQWRGLTGVRPPLDRVAIRCTFHLVDRRGDLDNRYTTIQDMLKAAGVIREDNALHVPAFSVRSVTTTEVMPWVEIRVREI